MRKLSLIALLALAAGCAPEGNPNAVGFAIDEMVLLKASHGVLLIDFVELAPEGKHSKYRWRYVPANGGPEKSGTGVVFEKYAKRNVGPDTYEVTDVGSQLAIKAGSFHLEWSSSSPFDAWLYVDRKTTQTTLLPDSGFASYELKKAVEQPDQADNYGGAP